MNIDRKHVAYGKAEQIERENHRKKPLVMRQKKPSRWRAGVCKICGESFTYISQDHAHKHGFANADEMAQAGVVGWME
jgi:hypothetical protein